MRHDLIAHDGTGTQPGTDVTPVVTGTKYRVVEEVDANGVKSITLLAPAGPGPEPEPEPPNPHPDDPEKHAEHQAALALVPIAEATHTLTSGDLPTLPDGAKVYIPQGVTVVVNREHLERIKWIRVNGTLRFASNVQANMRVDTCVVDAPGWLDLGKDGTPRTAPLTWTFIDNGPVSDPMQLGRGIAIHGRFDCVCVDGVEVTMRSEATERLHRGHVMVMHKPATTIDGLRILDCGRSDKSLPTTDFPNVENLRARYPLHFHRCNLAVANKIRRVTVENSPGWGIVNHESNVECDDSVCINTYGAGFIAETGREAGHFNNWRATDIPGIAAANYVDGTRGGKTVDDWGIGGHGMWVHGGNVKVGPGVAERCAHKIAVVAISYGSVFVPQAEIDDEFPLLKSALLPGSGLPARCIPIRMTGVKAPSLDLRALQNSIGQRIYRGHVTDCEFGSILSGYSNLNDYVRVRSIGNPQMPSGTAWSHTGIVIGHRYRDCDVRGYGIGVLSPTDGVNEIVGGTYSNVIDFLILNNPLPVQGEGDPTLVFDGVEFPPLEVEAAKFAPVQINSPYPRKYFPPARFNFYLAPWMSRFDLRQVGPTYANWQRLFHWKGTFSRHVIKVRAKGASQFEYLNFPEWGRDYPLPECVPASIREKYQTNGALYDATGCCLWGIVPVSGEVRPGSNGIWTTEPATFLENPKVPVTRVEVN